MTNIFEKHRQTLEKAVKAIHERTFYAHYPEHPGAYGEEAPAKGKKAYEDSLNKPFKGLLQGGFRGRIGEEASPYTGEALGVLYPKTTLKTLILNASTAFGKWRQSTVEERAGILIDSLERVSKRFHEIAHATMHTTGQSFVMSFQASGPHAADRALETVAMAYSELTHFPSHVRWQKPMGKITLALNKTFIPVPRGIGLVIGCSTFPTWNTVPGLYANLMAGNTVIVKPHPKAVLPIAIFVAEIQRALKANGYDPNTVQLAADTSDQLITKNLAKHPQVALIDYTGGSVFGNWIEGLKDKVTFTEKAGVNSVILDSARDLREVMRNLAFAVSLYSGQMCTAPQNFFIPETGIKLPDDDVCSYDDAVALLKNEISALVLNPKMGAGTLGAIQNPATLQRAANAKNIGGKVVLEALPVQNPEFPNARLCAPTLVEVEANDREAYQQELFGPILLVVKTKNTEQSLQIAKDMTAKHGAITCAAYTTDANIAARITDEMNAVFAPVSLNFTGFIWVNQHAAFSDFHVTGGNPAGNASFTDPNYINRRFVWVGNRTVVAL